MHSRAIVCTMCGGKFFPASMDFHKKACLKKQAALTVPCPICDKEIGKLELNEHIQRCGRKKGASGHGYKGGVHNAGGDECVELSSIIDDQGRMQCTNCHRWFLQDRISKHQSICRRVNKKDASTREFKTFEQRKFDGMVKNAGDIDMTGVSLYKGRDDTTSLSSPNGNRSSDQIVEAAKYARSSYIFSHKQKAAPLSRSLSPAINTESPKARSPKSAFSPRVSISSSSRPSTTGGQSKGVNDSRLINRDDNFLKAPLSISSTTSAPATPLGSRSRSSSVSVARTKTPVTSSSSSSHVVKSSTRTPASSSRSPKTPARSASTSRAASSLQNRPKSTFGSTPQRVAPPSGGGSIIPTNESSRDNTLAYPSYPY